jgi:uncharacterized protein
MGDREELIKQILQAANGEIVGRIRLQKIVYLLEQFGLHSNFRFSYYHYGPYSEELTRAIQHAEFLDKLICEREETTAHQTPYTVYSVPMQSEPLPKFVGSLPFEKAQRLIDTMKVETSVVIELAATIHWLKKYEKVADWRLELATRKPRKSTPENVDRAEAILRKLDFLTHT